MYHEKQRKLLCGVHAINNVVGERLLSRCDVDIEVGLLEPGHGTSDGAYSVTALQRALQKKGYILRKLGGKGHMWLGAQKSGHFLVLGCHRRHRLDALHYVGVNASANVVIDSARKTRLRLDSAGVLAVLSCGIDKLYRIQRQ